MNSILPKIHTDKIGAFAGSLCLLHCAVTPFLFVAKACSVTCCAETPVWWRMIDYLFIIISFFAIYHTTKHTSKPWVRYALWLSWGLLLLTIINESMAVVPLAASFVYVPAVAIIILHLYNMKYCRCADEGCCIASLDTIDSDSNT